MSSLLSSYYPQSQTAPRVNQSEVTVAKRLRERGFELLEYERHRLRYRTDGLDLVEHAKY